MDGDARLTREQILKAANAIRTALQTCSSPSDRKLLRDRYQELDALLKATPPRIPEEVPWIGQPVSPRREVSGMTEDDFKRAVAEGVKGARGEEHRQQVMAEARNIAGTQQNTRTAPGWDLMDTANKLQKVGVAMTGCGCWMFTGFPVLIILGVIAWQSVFPGPPPTPTVQDKSPAMQAKRMELIGEAIKLGVFQKVEPVNEWHDVKVWVEPGFYVLDFEGKKGVIRMVYCYFFDGTDLLSSVDVYDRFSGKKVASYSPALGFDMK